MSYVVGIDLGTTNSVISICRRGAAESIPVGGKMVMPSAVSYKPDGTSLVGAPAKARVRIDPQNTVVSVKRFMGDRSKRFEVGGQSKTPVEVSSEILRALKAAAEEHLREPVTDAVITVPAYFNDAQAEDTLEAGRLAGFNVLQLVKEPTAAAIDHGFGKHRDLNLLVYDLGGGTFDVTILKVSGSDYEVKSISGNSRLGGDDFDEKIIGWILEQFHAKTGSNLTNDHSAETLMTLQKLKEVAEDAKKELSQSDKTQIVVPSIQGKPFEVELTLETYNNLIAPLVAETIECVHQALRKANLSADQIDRVILVGGSTKNKAVSSAVKQCLKDPYKADRVDEAVSHGAAILGASLRNVGDVAPIKLKDKTAHSLGIDARDAESKRVMFVPIIKEQSPIPCSLGWVGSARPGQRIVEIGVFRGESTDPNRNERIGMLKLSVSFSNPNGVLVACLFNLDESGILTFTAAEINPTCDITRLMDALDENNALGDVTVLESIPPHALRTKTIQIGKA